MFMQSIFGVSVPETLPDESTSQGLAQQAQILRKQAKKTIYCLLEMGEITLTGKWAYILVCRSRIPKDKPARLRVMQENK